MSSLLALKTRAKAKEEEERAKTKAKREVLVLMLDHLSRAGYHSSVESLQAESGISLQKWQAADNMDLAYILQQFNEFYELKYNRQASFIRKATSGDDTEMNRRRSRRGQPFESDHKSGLHTTFFFIYYLLLSIFPISFLVFL